MSIMHDIFGREYPDLRKPMQPIMWPWPDPTDTDGVPIKPGDFLEYDGTKTLTKEDIDALAKKSGGDFWGCKNMLCENCPSKIDGKKPKEYYGTTQCYDAKALHILRLERERVAGEQA